MKYPFWMIWRSKMTFYEEWHAEENNEEYVRKFMEKAPESLVVFEKGTGEELEIVYEVLNHTPFSRFYAYVCKLDASRPVDAGEIPQYSDLQDGLERVEELLEFYPEGIPFSDLGYQLNRSKNELAQKKYGENHAKLAQMAGLAEIRKVGRLSIVCKTAWGSYLLKYSMKEKKSILQKMLLREYFVQKMLNEASKKKVRYRDIVCVLSDKTAERRNANSRELLEFILDENEQKTVLDNIIWKER